MEIYIGTNGTGISKQKESFCIKNDNSRYTLSSEKIEAIIFEAEGSITIGAIKLAVEKDIPIVISDKYGNIVGQFYKTNGFKSGELRKKQYCFSSSPAGFELGKKWIIQKIINNKIHLETLFKRRKKDVKDLEIFNFYIESIKNVRDISSESISEIMGYEGNSARIYFKAISSLLENQWQFSKREHQNAKEPYNIVLNYLFGILYRKLDNLLLKEGLDTTIGIIHKEGPNKLPLLYDFIEKYRFIATELTFNLFNKKVINDSFFYNGISKSLSEEGKKIIAREMYERLNQTEIYNGKYFKYIDIIKFDIKDLKNEILTFQIN